MRIRRHLALMATAILVPVVLFSALSLNSLLEAERDSLLQSMHASAGATRMAVEREWSYADGVARTLVVSYKLAEGDFAAFYAQARTANSGSAMHTALLDEQGQQVFNTVRAFDAPVMPPTAATRARVAAVLGANQTYISNLFIGRATGKHVVTLERPVRLNDGRRMVLSQRYYADHFGAAFPRANVPASWLLAVFDADGATIARNRGPQEFIGSYPRQDLLAAIRSHSVTSIRNRSRDGIDLYTVLAHTPQSRWTVAVGVPVSVVEASARNAVLMTGAGLLAAIALAMLAAYFFGRRLLDALDNAARAAIAIAIGKGEAPLLAHSPIDEVGKLEIALVEAGRALRGSAAEREFLLADAREARLVAESQNRAKDDFLAMLGHELRNPLSAITSGVSLLEHEAVPPDAKTRARVAIRRQCGLLTNIVDELLDASRVMTGKVALRRLPLDLAAAVRACLDAAAMRGVGAAHAVEVRLDAVVIDGDPTRIEQIVTNLFDNAVKYTPAGGSIEVTLRREQGEAVLRVRDNGMGMASALLPNIFEVFTQGAASLDRARGGLGVGLAVVRAMVLQHGGTVSADSAGEGQGSCFTVRIPCSDAVVAQAVPVARETPPAATVLVIDDNDDARDMLAQVLAMSGYHVLQAGSGTEGVRMAADHAPDVAVVDIGLPDISGYEVARQLRALPGAAQVRLVALTGYGQEADRRKALDSGFDAHMTKPADIDELIRVIAPGGAQ